MDEEPYYSSSSSTESEYSEEEKEEEAPVLGRTRSESNRGTKRKAQVRLPTSIAEIDDHLAWIRKQLHGVDIDRSASLRVLRAVMTMQKNYRQELARHSGQQVKKPRIRETICAWMGISAPTYGSILQGFLQNNRSVYVSCRGGNTTEKTSRIKHTKRNQVLVREFVRKRRMNRQRVTGRQVLDFLVEQRVLHVPTDPDGKYQKKALAAAYRSVNRWLEYMAYRRGPRKNMVPDETLALKRHQYLVEFMNNRGKPPDSRLREVYLDESYIHEHYHRNYDSIWDPNDEQDVKFAKDPAKGRRYCFAAAIRGPNPRVASPTGDDRAGVVPGTRWAFCPQKKEDHKGDYHKVFKASNFLQWWKESLLPNLKEPSVIMLDNAKYHKTRPLGTPAVDKMKKEEVALYMRQQYGGLIDERRSVKDLKAELRSWIEKNIPMEVVSSAEALGHKVLFTPPFHSDLQPIELVWARVKGNVGRQYSKDSNLTIIYGRLMKEFDPLDSDEGRSFVEKVINHCYERAKSMYDDMDKEEVDEASITDDDGTPPPTPEVTQQQQIIVGPVEV
jgi:transposase